MFVIPFFLMRLTFTESVSNIVIPSRCKISFGIGLLLSGSTNSPGIARKQNFTWQMDPNSIMLCDARTLVYLLIFLHVSVTVLVYVSAIYLPSIRSEYLLIHDYVVVFSEDIFLHLRELLHGLKRTMCWVCVYRSCVKIVCFCISY